MLTTLLGVALCIVLAYMFVSLSARAWRSRRLVVRIPGALLGGLLGLAFATVAAVAMLGVWRLDAPRPFAMAAVEAGATPERLARGEQLAWLCADCHASGDELPLNGGRENYLAGALPLGELYAPNLTPGGELQGWTDAQIVRAVRGGVDRHGVPLLVMPSQAYRAMSDEDVLSIVAYLRTQPALRHDQPGRNANFLAHLIIGAGLYPPSARPPAETVAAPAPGPTAEYGRYLVGIGICADCHGPALDGVPSNQFAPHGPSLHDLGARYTPDQFAALFRTGQTAAGRPAAAVMPWRTTGRSWTDDDLRAVYAYLVGLK